MEQYLDAKIKRFTQKQLFKKITKVKTMLGLGGLHPEKYLEVVYPNIKIVSQLTSIQQMHQ